ncbi:unnamed protein product, partial [Rotaria socialis]
MISIRKGVTAIPVWIQNVKHNVSAVAT